MKLASKLIDTKIRKIQKQPHKSRL